MKKRKNNILNTTIHVIIIIIFAYIIGFILSNYYLIKSNYIGIHKINDGVNIIKDNNKTIIEYNSNPIFIKDLLIEYDTNKVIDTEFEYKYKNNYGIDEDNSINNIINNYINMYSEKIDKVVTSFKLTIDSTNININNIIIYNQIDYFPSLSIFTIILSICIYMIFKYREFLIKNKEYLFLIIGICSGSLYIILRPIDFGQTWDEQIHFNNMYGLLNEYHTVTTNNISDNIFSFEKYKTKEQKNVLNNYLNNSDKIITKNKAKRNISYKKISYFLQSIIYQICSYFNVNFTCKYVIGKIVSLLTYLLIIFFAIKNTPILKYTMLIIGLVPIELLLASNYSYDPIIVALLLLGFAFYLKELKSNNKINYFNITIILLSFILGSFTKLLYVFLLLLLLTFKDEKYHNQKEKRLFKISIILLLIILFIPVLLPFSSSDGMIGDFRGGNTDVSKQLSLIKTSPLSFTKIFIGYIYQNFIINFIGPKSITYLSYFGNGNNNVLYIMMFLLLFSLIIDKEKLKISNKTRIIILAIVLFISVLIYGSMYLAFTEVGKEYINGVQARYFIPLLFPVLLIIYTPNIDCKIDKNIIYNIICISLLIIEFTQLFTIMTF